MKTFFAKTTEFGISSGEGLIFSSRRLVFKKSYGIQLYPKSDSSEALRNIRIVVGKLDYKKGPKQFHLVRNEDVTGISGEGIICEGAQFENGEVVLEWLKYGTIGIYPSIKSVEEIHGHNGATIVKWL